MIFLEGFIHPFAGFKLSFNCNVTNHDPGSRSRRPWKSKSKTLEVEVEDPGSRSRLDKLLNVFFGTINDGSCFFP